MKHFKFLFLFLFLFVSNLTAWADAPCLKGSIEDIKEDLRLLGDEYSQASILVRDVESFAKEHKLPTKVIEFGPPERRVKRLMVRLDITDEKLLEAYRKRYNLHTPLENDKIGGNLVFEIQNDSNQYVTGALREFGEVEKDIYRWGKKEQPLERWWSQWMKNNRGDHQKYILGFGHVIPLDKKQVSNVEHYLANPADRGACKSSNCIAWSSGIELGKTRPGLSDVDRDYLFPHLGVSRSSAHFEIGRRYLHAMSAKHSASFVFVQDKSQMKYFDDLEKYLPPEPQIPYSNIIRIPLAEDSPVMKAIDIVPDGGKVFVPIAAGASPEGMTALLQKAPSMKKGLDFHFSINGVSEAILKRASREGGEKIRFHSFFIGSNTRELNQAGEINLVHGYLSDFPKRILDTKDKEFHYDALLVRVSPPDSKGRYSLGTNNDMISSVLKSQPNIKIIAEINPNMPHTTGNNFITKKQITSSFESNSALASPPVVPFTKVEDDIGRNLASIIDDNSTIQMGIGNIFDGLPENLSKQRVKGLKISTEMLGDPLMKIMESGITTKAETGFSFGSPKLYKWLDGNKQVRFEPTIKVNDPTLIAKKERFHAINTALQVDLHGNVNATMGPGGRRISSPGGQVDFMAGAAKSHNGKSIIAIRSTAKNGEFSTITLKRYGNELTTPSEYVSHVVTEYGVASLKGKSEAEKTVSLIKVAHPKFRSELAYEAYKKSMISKSDYELFAKEAEEFKDSARLFVEIEKKGTPLHASEINYRVFGQENKETIVLVHGLGSSQDTWFETALDLSRRGYKVITYDQRGHGKTKSNGINFDSDIMADDLKNLLTDLNIKQAHIVGHSMGARTTIKFGEKYPDMVSSIMIEDMHVKGLKRAPNPASTQKVINEILEVKNGEVTKVFTNKEHLLLKLEEHYPREIAEKILKKYIKKQHFSKNEYDWPTSLTVKQRNSLRKEVRRGSKEVTVYSLENRIKINDQYYYDGLHEDLTESLIALKPPIQFLTATDQPVLFGKGIDHLREVKPSAKIVTIRNSSHGIHNSQPKAFVNQLVLLVEKNKVNPTVLERTVKAPKFVERFSEHRPLKSYETNIKVYGETNSKIVVIVPDFTKDVLSYQARAERLASKGYKVITYDLRGKGHSAALGTDYSLNILSDDLKMVLKTLNVKKADFFGEGLGAKIASRFILKNPNKAKKVVLYNPLENLKKSTGVSTRQFLETLPKMQQVFGSNKHAYRELRKFYSKKDADLLISRLYEKSPNEFMFSTRLEVDELYSEMALVENVSNDISKLNNPVVVQPISKRKLSKTKKERQFKNSTIFEPIIKTDLTGDEILVFLKK